jgi:hypothetical protein
MGLILGVGMVVRAWAGLAMFLVSYLNLPILASLHTGDGFWLLAPDARVYYNLAASAAYGAPIPAGSPSTSFLEVLSWWFRVSGRVPSSALLFNLALYVAGSVLLVAAFRPFTDQTAKRGALITLSAFSFSPVLIMLGTQPLKDVFSAFLIVVIAVALMSIVTAERRSVSSAATWGKVAAVAAALCLMAGVRAYYALFLWTAVALALTAKTLTSPRRLILHWGGLTTAILAVLWAAFMVGAGPYYVYYGNLVTRTIGTHLPVISPDSTAVAALPPSESTGLGAAAGSMASLRDGFIRSGGATNLSRKDASGREDAPGSAFVRVVREVAIGLAALLIPISVLKALGVVDFAGGRGFLLVTDLDTFFVDLALFAVVWTLYRARRPGRNELPFMCFAIGLGLVSGLLMAYVVTNYGTLFRLRLLATIPFWLVPLALNRVGASAPAAEPAPTDTDWERPAMPDPSVAESRSAI